MQRSVGDSEDAIVFDLRRKCGHHCADSEGETCGECVHLALSDHERGYGSVANDLSREMTVSRSNRTSSGEAHMFAYH